MKKITVLTTCLIVGSLVLAYGPGDSDYGMKENNMIENHNQKEYRAYHKNNKEGQRNNGPESFIKKLNLSVDQLKQIDKIKETADEKSRELLKESRDNRFKLREAIDTDIVNSEELQIIRKKILLIQEQLLDNHIKSMQEHRRILTKEQKEKLRELLMEREKEMLERKLSKNGHDKKFLGRK
ncbi:MAG: hypothetical protein A2Y40_10930 [Candidatus Margulisbacteria bacterium GWF2_35_9]|nr:MAG: hypothetical protein A2Y40_10930 [Candidatus Margulisbacteria bacterium GWF2_35_9]